jgi:hypothetical protein
MPPVRALPSLPPFVAAVLFAGLAPFAQAAGDTGDIVVRAEKDGSAIRIRVDCPVDAPRAVAWDVLTDYDNMAKFISNLEQSVVRMRFGDRLQVFQKGKAARGPLTFPFENLREIVLHPQREIVSRIIAGDAMPAEFTTRIDDVDGKLHIVHTGRYTPSIWVPPLLGPALIEAETRKQYGEIRDEILRRKPARQ